MKKFLLPVLALAVLVAAPNFAQADAKAKLVGTWECKFELDEKKLVDMFKKQGVDAAQVQQILPLVKAQFAGAKMTLKLNADGTSLADVNLGPTKKKEKGTWEVVSEKGKIVTIKGKGEDGEEETMELEFDGNDKFKLNAEELKEAPLKTPVFTRKK